jgi:hypothetical protein
MDRSDHTLDRLFSQISSNWAGRPLDSYETVLNYARTTRTTAGLRFRAHLVRKYYSKAARIPDTRPVPHGPPVGHPATTPRGFLCCVRFPCAHAVATTPAQEGEALRRSFAQIRLPRMGGRVGLCNDLFEACSVFTRVTACTLAGSSKMIRYIRGVSHFVPSMTAPTASG